MKEASDFTLIDQDGNQFNLFSNLRDFVMLVFYPKAGSLVCTRQLCSYNDNFEEFEKRGIKIIGISSDEISELKKFADKNSFKYTLLSDPKKEVCKAYDALNYAGGIRRKIIIISPGKKIIYEDSIFPIYYQKSRDLLNILDSNKYS